ncbi:MAG: type II toxin-antitoxin system HipA family toxin [Archangium sp.]
MSGATFELLIDGHWHRAGTLDVPDEGAGAAGQCFFEYDFDYLDAWLASGRFDVAASLTLPLEFGPTMRQTWPTFLDDLRPMGSARRWWLNRFRLPDAPSSEFRLLREGTVAPIGNVRIAESVPNEPTTPRRFPFNAVVEREHDFIIWAADHGAQVGGATGAGGESPKLLLRRDSTEVWIDVWQDEPSNADMHVLVKFARGKSERDRVILRSEYVYYRALQRLGIDTISPDGLELHEGENGPSLWLPRFDQRDGVRLGVESMYSLLGAAPGARLRHQDVLAALEKVCTGDWPSVLAEYVKRDVLNLVFGNSDNHGRNTSVLKSATSVTLAPVYDFAPMKMDPEGITRTTTWGTFERGGDVDWQRLLPTFQEHEAAVRASLRDLSERLVELPRLLRDLGLPRETLEFPAIGLEHTATRLKNWGLL